MGDIVKTISGNYSANYHSVRGNKEAEHKAQEQIHGATGKTAGRSHAEVLAGFGGEGLVAYVSGASGALAGVAVNITDHFSPINVPGGTDDRIAGMKR